MYQFRNSSFTKEQLTNLGITKEMSSSQPISRPLFPTLVSKPLEIERNNVAMDYKVLFKEDFRSRLFEIHNTTNTIKKQVVDNYSAQIAIALEKQHKQKIQFCLATKVMPAELSQPMTNKRKAGTIKRPVLKKRMVKDVDKHLDALAAKEARGEVDEESEKADSDVEAAENVCHAKC
jgi:hypothetical protein